MLLVPSSSQPGQAGNCGSMSTLKLLSVIEKDIKE
jgi:hypothetical protein